MAHFAKLGVNGKVIAIHAVSNKDILNATNKEDESVGQQFLERLHGWPSSMWIQTSYNTRHGKHYTGNEESADQSKALRGNYAGIGKIYDEDNDIFITKQPYASWTLNKTTAAWEPPVALPVGKPEQYAWNETTKAWDEVAT